MTHKQFLFRPKVYTFVAATALATSIAAGQQSPPSSAPTQDPAGWRRMSEFSDGQTNAAPAPGPAVQQMPQAIPGHLTLQPGTYFTIRTNQQLSSNQNRPGDEFTATLVKPIIVDGVVVADRGQTVVGRVTDAEKAGRIKGQSKLAIELTQLSLVDGTQVPVRSTLTGFVGGRSIGRDVTTVGVPTGVGAAIGGIAGGGAGAGIGAGAGAAAGLIGVLLTRGNPTVIYPESVLTFRTEMPIQISTERAPQAFRVVQQGDYDQPQDRPRMMMQSDGYTTVAPGYVVSPYYYGLGFGSYWGPWYGYGYGPGLGFSYYGGRGGFRGGGFGGGGFRGGGFRGGGHGGRR